MGKTHQLVLATLEHAPQLGAREIAARLGVTPGRVRDVLRDLEARERVRVVDQREGSYSWSLA